MNVTRGKIARELAAIEEELDRVLDHSLGPAFRVAARADRFRPAIDVFHATGLIRFGVIPGLIFLVILPAT